MSDSVIVGDDVDFLGVRMAVLEVGGCLWVGCCIYRSMGDIERMTG